jgi:hypothetical protein
MPKTDPRIPADMARASADVLLLFVPVARDAAASSVALASSTRPRLARSITMEETMRVLTQIELMRMTRIALGETLRQIMQALPDLPEGSENR